MKNSALSLTILLAFTGSAFAFNDTLFFDETKPEAQWQFIENKFISEIGTAKKSWGEYAQYTGAALVLAFAGSGLAGWNTDAKDKDIIKMALEARNAYTILTAGTVLYITNQLFQKHVTHSTNCKAVADFFANWDENQFYTPDELYDGFDYVAEMINADGDKFIEANADVIVETIQFFVKRHFEKRYEKTLQAEAALTLADAKTVTEILKNSVEAGSKLSGATK